MRWTWIVLLLLPLSAWPQWLHFDACGLERGGAHEVFTGKAEYIGPYRVWGPAITMIRSYQEPVKAKAKCTMLFVGNHQILVVGSLDFVMAKLRRAGIHAQDMRLGE